MANDFWTIKNEPPPNSGNALNGLQIHPVFSGTVITSYLLMSGSTQLKSTSDPHMPIHFRDVDFASRRWDLTAYLPYGPSGPLPGNGSWERRKLENRPDPDDTGDNGEFQAQAGTGLAPEASSSANA
jgi:hypothetical protein